MLFNLSRYIYKCRRLIGGAGINGGRCTLYCSPSFGLWLRRLVDVVVYAAASLSLHNLLVSVSCFGLCLLSCCM